MIKVYLNSVREAAPPDRNGARSFVIGEREMPLCVEVRTNWYAPGSRDASTKPYEYRVLLTTGGPALQVTGTLTEYGEPDDVPEIQVQDWFIPWTRIAPATVLGLDFTKAEHHEKVDALESALQWFVMSSYASDYGRRSEPAAFRWYSICTPGVFLEYRLPVSDARMTRKHRRQYRELLDLSERHGCVIVALDYRRG